MNDTQDPPVTGARRSGDELRDVAQLRRTVEPHRKIAGVAGGLARHLDIDPLLVRVLLVVSVFFGGAGLLLYGALWAFVPDDDGRAPLRLDDNTRTVAVWVGFGLAVVLLLGQVAAWSAPPLPILAVALLVLVLVLNRDRSRQAQPTAAQDTYRPPSGHTATGTTDVAEAGTAVGDLPASGWVGGTSAPPPSPPAPPSAPPSWSPPPGPSGPVGPSRREIRRARGPLLFPLALAATLLACGVLGLFEAGGYDVPDAAYPASALTVVGLLLVVGAWFGRTGGLILAGLVATAFTLGASASADNWGAGADRIYLAPDSASQVREHYTLGRGRLDLDLGGVTDVAALDGREIRVTGDVGAVRVLVPADIDVRVVGDVPGPGEISVGTESHGGFGTSVDSVLDASDPTGGGSAGPSDTPFLTLQVDLGVGSIDVRQAS